MIHYNLLRPFHNSAEHINRALEFDKLLEDVFRIYRDVEVYLLVAPIDVVKRRILLRTQLEPSLRRDTSDYPTTAIFDFVCRVDLPALYKRWEDHFRARNVPVAFMQTEVGDYRSLETDAAYALLSTPRPGLYSDTEARKAIEQFASGYQKVTATRGTYIDGADRQPTFDTIAPYLAGTTALDIGCAEGFFCFALERLGFSEVIGFDLKRERYLAANVIRTVTDSKCSFRLGDVFEAELRCTFDVVLMLNVIHHLKNPAYALRCAARLCQRVLIIEFPTLTDPKFNATVATLPPELNRLPLIGVSSLVQDQTFVFTEGAIERMCLQHEALFETVTFVQSPTSEHRRIAICRK